LSTKVNENHSALIKKHLNLFKLFLTFSEIGKQNKKCGTSAVTKYASSKKRIHRRLEVAVRKVLQEDWTFHRVSIYYKVPWSTLRENVVKASEHFDARCSDLKKFEIGKVGAPLALSSDLELRLAKYVIHIQALGFGLTILWV
jgi:hypothetical protein